MSKFIEVISEIKTKNNQPFAIADVNALRGGYMQVSEVSEMTALLTTNKLKKGMLCYVENVTGNDHIFQYNGISWEIWKVQIGSGGGSGQGVIIVDTLADLNDSSLKVEGTLVFIKEIKELRFYNGTNWESFNKIYIQNVPPDDLGGIWIDTTEDMDYNDPNNIISELTKVIYVLQERINRLEYAVQCDLDFGDFSNNKFNDYNDFTPTPVPPGTSVVEDNQIANSFLDNGIDPSINPVNYTQMNPTGKHLRIKSGTYAEMIKNQNDFSTKEMLWCYDKQELWIKDPKTYKLIKIGSTGVNPPDPPVDNMEGILTEVIGSGNDAKTRIVGIEFADMVNKSNIYTIRVKDGSLDVRNKILDTNTLVGMNQTQGSEGYYTNQYFPIPADQVGDVNSPKLYVNMIYCGNKYGDKDYNPVSHSFIELCNLGKKDLNLKGMFLHYTENTSGQWITLPLTGTLKSQGTFLIRCSQCSFMDINTTLIKVNEFDMEWTKDNTYNPLIFEIQGDLEAGVKPYSIWGNDNKLQLSYNCSILLTSADADNFFETNIMTSTAPYIKEKGVIKWYVDLVGIGTFQNVNMPSEVIPFPTNNRDTLLARYFNMDPVKQATKALTARSNATDWTYINLKNIHPEINPKDYTPSPSFKNKNVFFNKPLLSEGVPNIITCSLGHNAHTTRCFNWVSVGYYDEYIKIWEEGQTEADAQIFESFKSEDLDSSGQSTNINRPNTKNWNHIIYNRIRSITTDGTAFTVHKFMKDFAEPTTTKKYFYKVGREGFWSNLRSFTLRNKNECIQNGFNFLQVTDQQGFTSEEYETWKLSSEFINQDKVNHPFEFIINTGDATQNGNRINEWLSYFKGGEDLFKDYEQMYTVGNNDLCPINVYELGDGEDISKTNPVNPWYFFTFEHPFKVPISKAGVYVQCVYSFIYGDTYFLCMNSEITEEARSLIFGDNGTTNVYDELKTWCTEDFARYSNNMDIKWKVAFCHESPFTIITADLVLKFVRRVSGTNELQIDESITRGGSHLNTVGNYWFSHFLQDNNFKLCMCGHKHTYCNSRYLRDDAKTMQPIIYEPLLVEAPWYSSLSDLKLDIRGKFCCQLSANKQLNYVKYVMCQATGYKLGSNKELPSPTIPWLLKYYPAAVKSVDEVNNTASVTANAAQTFPNYIVWNVGVGSENITKDSNIMQEDGITPKIRSRILGKSFKLRNKNTGKACLYNYNVPILLSDVERLDANGDQTPSDNIIIENIL